MSPRKRPSWYTAEDARAERARRYGGDPTPSTQQAGRIAWFDGTCPICDQPITRLVSTVVPRHGEWVHPFCVNGADDE